MRRILFIGNNDRELFKNLVSAHYKKKFKIESSLTMAEVVDLICSNGSYDLYIIDVDFKDLEPKQLWSDINDLGGERQVLFLGSKHILTSRLDMSALDDNNMAHILERPILVDKFKNLMDEIIDFLEESDKENNTIDAVEDDFFPMKLRSFYLHSRISFDAYARITSSKFLKVINREQKYTISYLQTYLRKGVKFLYLKKDDRLKMLENSLDQCQTILSMPELSFKKAMIIQGVGTGLVHEYIRLLGVTDQVLELASLLGESIRRYNQNMDTFKEVLVTYDPTNKTIEGRSILTAYVADSILMGLGWNADLTRRKLSLSAIIHDSFVNDDQLGTCLTLNDSIVKKMTLDEQNNYRNHPNKASEVARHFSDCPEVDFIVEQHHEMPKSDGFPRGISGLQITVLSAVFATAVHFSTYVSILGTNPITIRKIMGKLKEDLNQGNFRQGLKVLEDLVRSL